MDWIDPCFCECDNELSVCTKYWEVLD